VYVAATGHTVSGQMLDYWRANGADAVYGNPVSEPFAAANGLYSQAFEAGVFQFNPDYLWTDDPTVRLMPISRPLLNDRLGRFRSDGRRDAGGGDRRDSAWRAVDPAYDASAAEALASGGVYEFETGHTISGDLLAWYQAHEGRFYLGNPISQPLRERGAVVQYFEGGLLTTDGQVTSLAPLVAEHAADLRIETGPVPQGDLPEFDESLFWTTNNPWGGDASAVGKKRIVVSITEQTMWVYQGDTLILQSLVSTGKDPNGTEVGDFHVRIKELEETMAGFTDATGEVVAFGDEASATRESDASGERYEVADVPHVMYINFDAEALHGAYWHDNFGEKMSHGCINLPLDVAAFLFGWAPLGTEIRVLD
ncbi:MAG: L,D-transpeptidase, partial [Chloroflexota bacterium]|nr:L,D-transpeptidase [Chloroflexota bacterium]